METRSEFKFHPNLKSPEAGYDQGHLSRERSMTEAGRERPPLKSFLLQTEECPLCQVEGGTHQRSRHCSYATEGWPWARNQLSHACLAPLRPEVQYPAGCIRVWGVDSQVWWAMLVIPTLRKLRWRVSTSSVPSWAIQ